MNMLKRIYDGLKESGHPNAAHNLAHYANVAKDIGKNITAAARNPLTYISMLGALGTACGRRGIDKNIESLLDTPDFQAKAESSLVSAIRPRIDNFNFVDQGSFGIPDDAPGVANSFLITRGYHGDVIPNSATRREQVQSDAYRYTRAEFAKGHIGAKVEPVKEKTSGLPKDMKIIGGEKAAKTDPTSLYSIHFFDLSEIGKDSASNLPLATAVLRYDLKSKKFIIETAYDLNTKAHYISAIDSLIRYRALNQDELDQLSKINDMYHAAGNGYLPGMSPLDKTGRSILRFGNKGIQWGNKHIAGPAGRWAERNAKKAAESAGKAAARGAKDEVKKRIIGDGKGGPPRFSVDPTR